MNSPENRAYLWFRWLVGLMILTGLVWGRLGPEYIAGCLIGWTLGCGTAAFGARSQWSTSLLLTGSLFLWIAGALVGWMIRGTGLAGLLGGATAIFTSGLLQSMLWMGSLAWGFTILARRVKGASVVELAIGLLTIGGLFSAHRDGAIGRPLWLGDMAIGAAIDPVYLLTGIGVLAAVLALGLRLMESPRGKLTMSLTIAALAVVVFPLIYQEVLADRLEEDPVSRMMGNAEDEPPGAGADDAGQADPEDGQSNPSSGGQAQGQQPARDEGGGQGAEAREAGGSSSGEDAGEGEGSEEGENEQASESPPPAAVAVVLLGDDVDPEQEIFYFLQDVHSSFNGARMVPAEDRNLMDTDVLYQFPEGTSTAPTPWDDRKRERITGSVSTLTPHVSPFALDRPAEYRSRDNPNPARFVRSWFFESRVLRATGEDLLSATSQAPSWSAEQREAYLEGPDDPRYSELAAQLVEQLPEPLRDDPYAVSAVFRQYLNQEMVYDLSRSHEGTTDPTASFLFGDLQGYCVHAAHAMVYLLRSRGFPARVATGYAVKADTLRGSVLVVFDRDAHAWPQLYTDQYGWVEVDVTPEQVAGEMGEQPPFDEELARQLGELAREEPPKSQTGPSWARQFGQILAVVLDALRWGLLQLPKLILLMIFGAFVLKAWRRLSPYVGASESVIGRAYRTGQDVLTEAGLPRKFGETPEKYASRVKEVAPSFQALADVALRRQLGPPTPVSSTLISQTRQALTRTKREVDEAIPLWRRLAGLLDLTTLRRSR